MPGLVRVEAPFELLLVTILPLTSWWRQIARADTGQLKALQEGKAEGFQLDVDEWGAISVPEGEANPRPQGDAAWFATLAGAILTNRWARADGGNTVRARRQAASAVARVLRRLPSALKEKGLAEPATPSVFRISLNRRVSHAAAQRCDCSLTSRATIKADAAKRVFGVDCSNIVWAVVDSGIAPLPAFTADQPGSPSRVVLTYDLTRLTGLTRSTGVDPKMRAALKAEAQAIGAADPVLVQPFQRRRDASLSKNRSTVAASRHSHRWCGRQPDDAVLEKLGAA